MNQEARTKRHALAVAFASGAAALAGVMAAIFFARNPDVWSNDGRAPIFRVQSRSMEPSYRGPRFAWLCPECGETFETAIDADFANARTELVEADGLSGATPSANDRVERANDYAAQARQTLSRIRYFTCPKCGYDRVPVESPRFEEGASIRSPLARKLGDPRPGFLVRLRRALKRETNLEYRRRESEASQVRPQRWDAVVFRDRAGRLTLKRAVGLPGELVAIVNGDVFIDGKIPFRTLEQIARTASPVRSVDYRLSDKRLDAAHVTPIRTDDGTRREPTAISNESPTPCLNGSNVCPVELVRDFVLNFNWYAEDGLHTKFSVLAQRPEKAFLITYDEALDSVTIREKTLYNGVSDSGKTFEELTESDFVNESGSMFNTPPRDAVDSRFTIAIVDGSLIFAIDGEEALRYSTKDAESGATRGVSTPFAILGQVARARNVALYRDLHYSNADDRGTENSEETRYATLLGHATKTPQGRYFLLGDNSPASLDSRFDAVGTIDEKDLLFIVE